MQQTCSRCGSINTSSRFCTNCGTTLENGQHYRQSWETPSAQDTTVPPWARTQVQSYQPANAPNPGIGFGGQNDAQVKRLLLIASSVILGGVLLLIVCIALAIVIPISSVRLFFLIVAVLLIWIPWMIYRRIRRYIRRTFGNIGRFL